jgi:hypothetical protein
MNTKDAERLLREAEHDLECKAKRPCEACGAREEARLAISRLGFTRPTLRVASKLAAVAKDAHEDCPCDTAPGIACSYREALAEWKKL